MGIPRLTTHLSPYAEPETWRSKTQSNCNCNCNKTRTSTPPRPLFIIDGPALAHFVFQALLGLRQHQQQQQAGEKGAGGGLGPLNAVDAQQQISYADLGKAAVRVLEDLRVFGDVHKIYFDGALPLDKRSVRQDRLQAGLKKLIVLQSLHPDGFKVRRYIPNDRPNEEMETPRDLQRPDPYPGLTKSPSTSSPSSSPTLLSPLLSLSAGPFHSPSLPTPPFLVPAVIEHIRLQELYAPLVELVPGEADSFCAQAARQLCSSSTDSNVILPLVLSSDSDLLIHDLGPPGGVSFLRDLELAEESDVDGREGCEHCTGTGGRGGRRRTVLKAPVSRRDRVAQRLGLDNGQRVLEVAFEVKRDPGLTLAQAVAKMKRKADGELVREEAERMRLEAFMAEYGACDDESNGGDGEIDRTALQNLDPRVSEFITQVRHQSPVLTQYNIKASIKTNTKSQADNQKPPTNPVHVYMPLLHEDPARVSAWSVGREMRQLAYSVALHAAASSKAAEAATIPTSAKPTSMMSTTLQTSKIQKTLASHPIIEVIEFSRKGHLIGPTEIDLLSESACRESAEAICRKMLFWEESLSDSEASNSTTSTTSTTEPSDSRMKNCRSPSTKRSDPHFWHTLALLETLHWHFTSGRTLPADNTIDRALNPASSSSSSSWSSASSNQANWCSWQDIHLAAQVQAVLYSWRTARQVLSAVFFMTDGEVRSDDNKGSRNFLPQSMRMLAEKLTNLPGTADLMSPQLETQVEEAKAAAATTTKGRSEEKWMDVGRIKEIAKAWHSESERSGKGSKNPGLEGVAAYAKALAPPLPAASQSGVGQQKKKKQKKRSRGKKSSSTAEAAAAAEKEKSNLKSHGGT